jgi:hypothetical protein
MKSVIEKNFVSSLVWYVFSQQIFRYMLSTHWHEIGLVNKSCDTFCFLAG